MTHEEACHVMCTVLGLEDITEFIVMSDETIRVRSADSPELADLLIGLKNETKRHSIAALTGSAGGTGGHAGHAGGAGGAHGRLERHDLLLQLQNMW